MVVMGLGGIGQRFTPDMLINDSWVNNDFQNFAQNEQFEPEMKFALLQIAILINLNKLPEYDDIPECIRNYLESHADEIGAEGCGGRQYVKHVIKHLIQHEALCTCAVRNYCTAHPECSAGYFFDKALSDDAANAFRKFFETEIPETAEIFQLSAFRSKMPNTLSLKTHIWNAIFETKIQQEPGVGACFAASVAMKLQYDDPMKLVELFLQLSQKNSITIYNGNAKIDIPINVCENPVYNIGKCLQYALVRTLMDAGIQIEDSPTNETRTDGSPLVQHLFFEIARKCVKILGMYTLSQNDTDIITGIQEEAEKTAIEMRLCFDSRCDKNAWRKSPSIWKRLFSNVDEGKGAMIPHISRGGDMYFPVTRNNYADIIHERFNIVQRISNQDARNELVKFLKKEPPEIELLYGGFEQCILSAIYGPDKYKYIQISQNLTMPEQIFCTLFLISQQELSLHDDIKRIVASGPSHAFCIFLNGDFGKCINSGCTPNQVLENLKNSGKYLAFIDPNWVDYKGDAYRICIHWNKSKNCFELALISPNVTKICRPESEGFLYGKLFMCQECT